MKSGLALFLHSARRARTLILAVAALLVLFQVLLIIGAESLHKASSFPRIAALVPDVLRQVLGPSLLTMLSFSGIACLGYFHVAVQAVLIGLMIALGTEPAGEAETRFLDLVLAHPVARHWVITRTIALLLACAALLAGAMMLGSRVGLYYLVSGELARATFRPIPKLSLNLAVLIVCWGGIALAMATTVHRRSVAAARTALLAAAFYMVDLIAQVWKPLKPLARYSPFHYYNTLSLITGSGNASSDIIILACLACSSFLLAYIIFQYRDL